MDNGGTDSVYIFIWFIPVPTEPFQKGCIFMTSDTVSSFPQDSGVYFIGIGGISMSSLARILHGRGVRVAGYDLKKSEQTESLIQEGIPVYYESAPAHQEGYATVVYTAAISENDPEMVCARERGATLLSRAELLGALVSVYPHSVGVAGTHGKSTTTAMLSEIFEAAKADATVLAGAVIPSLGSTYHAGKGYLCVFEACEYKNSYHAMHPTVRVVLNCELDHVDFFGSLDNVIDSFHTYLNADSGKGENIALINADCSGSVKAAEGLSAAVHTFSVTDRNADFYADALSFVGGYPVFDIYAFGKKYCHAEPGVPGQHNVSNALAAAGAAYLCGIEGEAVSAGLSAFCGVKRRFEKRGMTKKGAVVVDDYAHHPDEVRATLGAAKAVCAGRVYCIFQPHTYSRFTALMEAFAQSLSLADEVIMAEIYAAREVNTTGVSSKDICAFLPEAAYFESFSDIAAYVSDRAEAGDMILTMGAGDIDRVVPLLVE